MLDVSSFRVRKYRSVANTTSNDKKWLMQADEEQNEEQNIKRLVSLFDI